MHNSKIPIINDKFDIAIFLQILRKTYWVAALLIMVAIVIAFIYFRYTPNTYQSVSILQINEQNRSSQLLKIEDVYENTDLSQVIELLRSKEFLKRALSNLPLEVSYYVEGTFLSNELYLHSPFIIEAKANMSLLYDKNYYIDFTDAQNAVISYSHNEKTVEIPIKTNQWQIIDGGEIRYQIVNWTAITNQQNNYKSNRYYFHVNNPNTIVESLINDLQINLLSKSAKTILIQYSGNNAEKTAHIVNTIAEQYLVYDVQVKKESAENILAFIDEQLKVVYKNLDQTEKELHAFKKENKINTGQNQPNGSPFPIFTTKINEFEDELINIEFELMALRRISTQIKNNDKLNVYELIASLAGTKSEAVVVNVLSNLQSLINQKEQLLNDVTPDNLKIKILEKQIENQKQLLVDFINTTIDRLQFKKTDYDQKIAEYEQKLFSDKDFNELEFSKLSRIYDINEGFYHKLIEKKAEYLISQAGFVSQNTILEKAEIPRLPKAPLRNKIYPIFFLLGLFAGATYILLRYLFYDEVTSIGIIQSYTSAPILGTIPVYKNDIPVSQLLVNKQPNSAFTESFRTIRSNLQFISHGAETKLITVSSTISGEGKTFVAINLAGILAINGRKVVVIDLDLRKPRIHLGFNVPNDKGISTILIGKNKLNECIQHSEIPGFDYVTAGPVPPNPSELAASKQMDVLIAELEEDYDIIIIDTPPVGIVTDALVNLRRANYPIYVMKANVSKRHFIENINSLIKEKNMDNLSIILNGVDISGRKYGYGYGYGYYTDEDEKITISKQLAKKLQKLKK